MASIRPLTYNTSSFRTQLLIWLSAVATLCLGVLLISFWHLATVELQAEAGRSLQQRARTAAELLNKNLLERQIEVELLAQSHEFTKSSLTSPNIRETLKAHQDRHTEYAWIGVADPAGMVLQATGGMLEGENAALRPWFQAARNGTFVGDVHEAAMLSKLLPTPSDGEPIRFVDVAAPIKTDKGQLVGVLATHLSWTWVTKALDSVLTDPDQGIEVLLANKSGHIIYPQRYAKQGKPSLLPSQSDAHWVTTWEGGSQFLTSAVILQATPQNDLQWQVIVRQPIEVLQRQINAITAKLSAIGLLVLCVLGLLSTLVSKRFSKPIERIALAATQLGSGTLTTRIEAHTADTKEIVGLVASFNMMAAHMNRAQDALEATVHTRTAELALALEQSRGAAHTLSSTLQHLKEAQQLAQVGSWSWDLVSHSNVWSEEHYRIYGVDPSIQPNYDLFMSLLSEQDRPRVMAAVAATLGGLAPYNVVCDIVRPDGVVRTLQIQGKLDLDDNKVPVAMTGTSRDITELKQIEREFARAKAWADNAQMALEKQSKLLSDVVDAVPIGVAVYDENQLLKLSNRNLVTILGLDADIFNQPNFGFSEFFEHLRQRRDYGSDLDASRFKANFISQMQAGEPVTMECRMADGSYIELRAAPLSGGWSILTYFDVTERRTEQIQLLRAQETVRLATEISGIGIWEVDFTTAEHSWDAQQYRLYGLEPQSQPCSEALWASLLHPDDRERAAAAFRSAIDFGADYEAQFRIIWADGSVRSIKSLGRPHFDVDGHLISMVGTNRDITDEVTYADSMQRASQLASEAVAIKGQFLANMSHELRTPMNAVLGLLQLLENTSLTSRQNDYVKNIQGAAKSLLALLNDILDFSKIEAGKLDLEVQAFRIEHFLRELAVVLSTYVGGKKIEVLYDIDPQIPETLFGDSQRLKQILINLAGNAIKFTEAGQVVVAMRIDRIERGYGGESDAAVVEFCVADSGIGIAPENIPKLFTSFSQAEASTTRKFGGTGLGLAISQLLVDLMGGSIELQSELGVGSTFRFKARFPFDAASEVQAPPQPHRVLLVESNPVAGQLIAGDMANLGWAVDTATSGSDALAMLGRSVDGTSAPYTLVYVAWRLPLMDGWTTVKHMHQLCLQSAAPSPRYIVISANGRDALELRSQDEQDCINALLVKPFTCAMLLASSLPKESGGTTLRRATRSNARVLSGLRILVVDDNAINQQVAEELLSAQGADVSIASEGQQAVHAIQTASKAYDIVLMDIQMPVMDGYEATRFIRDQLGLVALPIIGLTANAMASDRTHCLDAGMNEHVGKPFDLAQLVSTIIRLTGHQPVEGAALNVERMETAVGEIATSAGADIDLQAALNRLGGIKNIYAKTASDFRVELSRFQGALSEAIHSGNRKQALTLLHTFKGNAGLVGLVRLAKHLADLESEMKADAHLHYGDEKMSALGSCIADAQVALDQAIAHCNVHHKDAAAPAPDLSKIKMAMSGLKPLLAESDLTALEFFAEHRSALQGLPTEYFERLEIALQNLEFDEALEVLEEAQAIAMTIH